MNVFERLATPWAGCLWHHHQVTLDTFFVDWIKPLVGKIAARRSSRFHKHGAQFQFRTSVNFIQRIMQRVSGIDPSPSDEASPMLRLKSRHQVIGSRAGYHRSSPDFHRWCLARNRDGGDDTDTANFFEERLNCRICERLNGT